MPDVKVDSIGLTGYLFKPYGTGIEGFQKEFLLNLSANGLRLVRQIDEAVYVKPKWLKDMIASFADYGIVDVQSTVRFVTRPTKRAIPYLHIVGMKDEFKFVLQLHFDGIPRFFWSGSLFNFHTGSYTDLDRKINNAEAYRYLMDYLDEIKFKFIQLLGLDELGELEHYGYKPWHLHRLDLAVDYKIGLENAADFMEKLKDLKLAGYRSVQYREYYKALFVPVYRDDGKKRLPLPTINVYNKSMEIQKFFGENDDVNIPDGFLEDGIVRIELQFYHGGVHGHRKDMTSDLMRKVKKAFVMKTITDEMLEEVVAKFDVVSDKIMEGKVVPITNETMRKIHNYIKHRHGAFSMKGILGFGKFAGDEVKRVKKIVTGLVSMGCLTRVGHNYLCNDSYHDGIARGYLIYG